MRQTSGRRRAGGSSYAAKPRVPADAQAPLALPRVAPDPDAGLYTCTHCGGGAPLIPWANAKKFTYAEERWERVDRLATHTYGGTAVKGGHRGGLLHKCPGSMSVPAEFTPPEALRM